MRRSSLAAVIRGALIQWMYYDITMDIPLRLLAGLSVVLLFIVQYYLCTKAKTRIVKELPFLYVLLSFLGGYLSLTQNWWNEGKPICALFCSYAVFCLLAILLAWAAAWWFVLRKLPPGQRLGKDYWQNPTIRRWLIAVIALLLGLCFAVGIKWSVGYRPYKNLTRSELTSVEFVGVWEPQTLTDEQTEEIVGILNNLVIYRKLLYQTPGEGQKTEQFVLNYRNGDREVLAGNWTEMIIDHVIFRSSYISELDELWVEYKKLFYGN